MIKRCQKYKKKKEELWRMKIFHIQLDERFMVGGSDVSDWPPLESD